MLGTLVLAAAAAAAAAPDPSAAVVADMKPALRCAIVSLSLASSTDAAVRSAGMISTFYWFDRIDARVPDAELTRMLQDEVETMTGADLKLEAQRCGGELNERGRAMQAMGKAFDDGARKKQMR
jgi:hypothetical protein